MLEHLNASPQKPKRVVVMGSRSFVGGAILERLAKDDIPVLPLARTEVDLLSRDAPTKLAAVLRPDDTFVAVAAIAPCKDSKMLVENMIIARAMVHALSMAPVAHVVNVSSDAVYGDDTDPLTERSHTDPTSLHGVMHLARELIFRNEVQAPLAIVRPTLIYGLTDPHNGYGPNRFRRLASEGKEIVLFGEGEECRDHVDIDDVAELARLIIERRSIGILNVASGVVVSFRELAEFAASEFPARVPVRGTPRKGPMPHNGYRAFDISAVHDAFPGFLVKSWREGLSRMHAIQREQK